MTGPGRERYAVLDGLRGLAAMVIVIHHFTASSGQREIFASASIAVDFFFCLSGFVIASAYQRRLVAGMSLRDYAMRRLSRLYPMFALGCAIGFVALVLLKHQGLAEMTWNELATAATLNVLYLPYLNDGVIQIFQSRYTGTIFPLDAPAWSVFFGLFANALYGLTIRRSPRWPLIFAVTCGAILFAVDMLLGEAPGWGTRNFIGGFPRVVFDFFAGVVIFQLQPRLQWLPRVHPALIALAMLVILATPRFPGHRYYWLFASVLLMPPLVALAARCTDLRGELPRWIAMYAGALSYPVFCLHFPLLALLSAVYPGHVGVPLLCAYLLATILISHLAHRFLEQPLRGWLGARTQRATP